MCGVFSSLFFVMYVVNAVIYVVRYFVRAVCSYLVS